MEFLEGGELLKYIEDRTQIPESEARIFFLQMIDAIDYCHKEQLIHRDLKLENILLQDHESKLIKIVDFGIAGQSSNLKLDKANIGSLLYMAPEVLKGNISKIGPSIDIWSLGCILFAMVLGKLVY
jgi:MAP/microtubule affinity-regulating kinase